MKKSYRFFLVMFLGIGIAVTVKANRSAINNCCDDFGKVCAIVNGQTFLGPPRAPHGCP
ncbi:hypothetical protein ACX0G9_15335 [Flavitalea flava]